MKYKYYCRNVISFFSHISEASSLDDISLLSTPKRSSTSQTVSTPTSVPIIESAEAIEAKAALKQVKIPPLHLYFELGFLITVSSSNKFSNI